VVPFEAEAWLPPPPADRMSDGLRLALWAGAALGTGSLGAAGLVAWRRRQGRAALPAPPLAAVLTRDTGRAR
jgi:hypothetical protein